MKKFSIVIAYIEDELDELDILKEVKKLLLEKYEKKAYVKNIYLKNKGERE